MLDRLLSNACRLAPLALLLGKVGTVDAGGRLTFAWPELGKPCAGSLSPNRNLEYGSGAEMRFDRDSVSAVDGV